MISISGLDFSYGDHVVFAGLSVELPERGVIALRGSNGVGKTTLLKLLGGLLPSANNSLRKARTLWRLVYLDTDFLSLDSLTVAEYLALMELELGAGGAVSSGLIDPGMLSVCVRELSLGQRQRCVLALALTLPDVDVLLLDEPLNGLDAAASAIARAELMRAGRRSTVLLATHEVSDWAEADLTLFPGSTVDLSPRVSGGAR
ncbi:ABC-2 type transport system ATP-binding protein/heme exporter protein A [Propionibacterium cyclohexanicum]|uniref:ABC-2 type transport system ATP-binding protein/heme exporter protein A n=1 Tax=Propionibacterium cyclohexanicum TaxID=64702 RepID=A0A1H9QG22_9ACTN|nr:ATP-binding cassette domain-containing protein [Propionibacterium cyclohexanicum]SER59367.1 ABC-2 type transport system ATP-binding protein/heme exporter protein A [Propionibacterium cyclohexanicum]